jgi:hypothetical protein
MVTENGSEGTWLATAFNLEEASSRLPTAAQQLRTELQPNSWSWCGCKVNEGSHYTADQDVGGPRALPAQTCG